jgi:hypothetical protein
VQRFWTSDDFSVCSVSLRSGEKDAKRETCSSSEVAGVARLGSVGKETHGGRTSQRYGDSESAQLAGSATSRKSNDTLIHVGRWMDIHHSLNEIDS